MAMHDLTLFRHDHAFDDGNRTGERRTWIVVAITALTMVAEIVGGWLTGGMALLADGWHMATHGGPVDRGLRVLPGAGDEPLTPEAYCARVRGIPALAHVSFEVNRCLQGRCA